MNTSRRKYVVIAAGLLGTIGRHIIRYLGKGDLRVSLLASTILLAGLALRIWHFGSGRSLWLDEAMVATSIVGRDWYGLLQPLEYLQLAPIGWLFVEKFALEAIGGLELALRLPQFLFGVGSLAVFFVVARRYLGQVGFVVAIAIFALASQFIYYSAEVKPYGVDIFFSVVLLFFSGRYFVDKAHVNGLDISALAVLGTAAAACSFPSIIIMASFGCLLLLREILHRRFATAAFVAAVGLLWLVTYLWFLLNFSRSNTAVLQDMSEQWSGGFAPLLPTSKAELMWFATTGSDFFQYVFGKASTFIAIGASCVGIWVLIRKRPWFAAAVLLPFVVAWLVSALQLYPISNRATLYLMPQLIMLVAAGVQASISEIRPRAVATLIAMGLVLAGPASALWQNFTSYPAPYADENIRPVLEDVAARKADNQPIYVHRNSMPAFRLYQNLVGLGDATVIEGKRTNGDLGCLLAEIQSVRHRGQIWIVYSHADKIWSEPEEALFKYFADIAGQELIALSSVSVQAFLIDFDAFDVDRFKPLLQALPPRVSCG